MAKGAYLGISDTARKVKNIYVGVDGVARKIKKAYIGDENGLARLCWSTGTPLVSGMLYTNNSTSFTVSGLDFQPTGAALMATSNTSYEISCIDMTIYLVYGHGGSYFLESSTGGACHFDNEKITINSNNVIFDCYHSSYPFLGYYRYVIWGDN